MSALSTLKTVPVCNAKGFIFYALFIRPSNSWMLESFL